MELGPIYTMLLRPEDSAGCPDGYDDKMRFMCVLFYHDDMFPWRCHQRVHQNVRPWFRRPDVRNEDMPGRPIGPAFFQVDVLKECQEVLGPSGVTAVQLSPVAEHLVGPQWWVRPAVAERIEGWGEWAHYSRCAMVCLYGFT